MSAEAPAGRAPPWRSPQISIAAFCLLYTAASGLLLGGMGLLEHVDEVTFSSVDARKYRQLADFYSGHGESPGARLLGLRPAGYPLFCTLHRPLGSAGFALLQWCLNLVTVVATFASVRRLTGSQLAGLVACGLLVAQPTFSFLALHALSESLGLALVAAGILCTMRHLQEGRKGPAWLATFLFSAATITKPTYLPFLVAWLGYAGWKIVREGSLPARRAWLVPLALSPIVLQLALSAALTGSPTLSTAGRHNLEKRFFPAVWGFASGGSFVHYRSPEAEQARAEHPHTADQIRFVVAHPAATLRTTAHLLFENLRAPSSYVGVPESVVASSPLAKPLRTWSKRLNRALFPVHLLGLCLFAYRLSRSRDAPYRELLLVLACLGYSTLLLTALSYAQGDRLALAAAPAWLALYAALLSPPADPVGNSGGAA